ncbi:MFS_1_like domain-containing protein [Caerostris darwini]|uniref:MFS_1_like domain-containing protein n=1 Tax=Caerostris darwini TaxID=1538125 RepID=A0AAV4NNT3_9ARAC|nr:MFS_1_like domain-containing protein [Caerostris darwini]
MNSIYGLPFLYTSKWIVKKVGETNIFLLALLAHAVCYFGYSYLQVAWPAVLFELKSILTYHLLWVAVISYCTSVTPKGLLATVNTTAGSIHFVIGRITGGSLGGLLMSSFNGIIAFRVMAAVDVAFAFFYGLFLYCRRRSQLNIQRTFPHQVT